ncbi:MAG: helix-turn-helix transcriptional regulator [Anaerolineales bacterium]|nr:helix-turn-helix transcriptional regulator [Anaerolineales bacterium]
MTVKHGILGLLALQPRYGYELRAAFLAVVGGEQNWDLKPAQIYSTLARLEEAGLVKAAGGRSNRNPEKRVFAITALGRRELERWFEVNEPPDHQRDATYLKMVLSLATGLVDSRKIISRERAMLYRELHRATARRSEADPNSELSLILLLDKSVMHLEADLRWLDMLEARLDEIKDQPVASPELRPRGRPKKAKRVLSAEDERAEE